MLGLDSQVVSHDLIHPFDNYVTTTLFSTSDHLKWKGFQVFFSWPCTEKQNILLQHMHEKELFILTNKCGNKLYHENEAPGDDLEPRFRVNAYFHIY